MSSVPILYIFNDSSKRYVKKDGSIGKKIILEKKQKNEAISFFQDKKGQKPFLGTVEIKRKRCPKGENRDKVTGKCVKKDMKTRKRCPNGTRRDPKTQKCVEKLGKKTDTPPVITPIQKEVPRAISENLETLSQKLQNKNANSTLEDIYKKNNLSLSDLSMKWSIINVPPDHYCGYHCLSLFLRLIKNPFVSDNESENIEKLTKKLYDSYVLESQLPESSIEKADIEKRMKELKDSSMLSKWMTDEDMVLYSKIFNICFVVLREDPTLNMLHWQIFSYDSSLEADFQSVYNKCKRTKKLIFLYNPDFPGLHYDLLLPQLTIPVIKFNDYKLQNDVVENPVFRKTFILEPNEVSSPNEFIVQLTPEYQSTDYSSAPSKKPHPKNDSKQYVVELTPEFQSTDYSSAQQSKKPVSRPIQKKVNKLPQKSPFVRHSQNQLRSMIQKCFNK